jgi:GNAT superfamily N-acetyltransferase
VPEILRVPFESLADFYRAREREALASFYGFPAPRIESVYGFAAVEEGETVGAGTLRVADLLGHVERIVVDTQHRRRGVGRAIAGQMAEVARYYNCHKMTVMAPHRLAAQQFFEACGYRVEAVLPQHAFKLDIAVLRKFLL